AARASWKIARDKLRDIDRLPGTLECSPGLSIDSRRRRSSAFRQSAYNAAMSRALRVPGALAAIAFALTATTPVAAAPEDGLAFLDDRPRSALLGDAVNGIPVDLCNVGSGEAVAVTVTLTGFEFKQKRIAEDVSAVLVTPVV